MHHQNERLHEWAAQKKGRLPDPKESVSFNFAAQKHQKQQQLHTWIEDKYSMHVHDCDDSSLSERSAQCTHAPSTKQRYAWIEQSSSANSSVQDQEYKQSQEGDGGSSKQGAWKDGW